MLVFSVQGDEPRSTEILVSLNFLSTSVTTYPAQFDPMQESFRLSESLNVGYVVVTASASTTVPGSTLVYRIAGGNQEDTFTMNGGQLKVGRELDYERVQKYSLWLGVRDSVNELSVRRLPRVNCRCHR